MHDLHAADLILKIVLEKAGENKLKKVKKIIIELGSVIEHGAEINPENLRFNLNLLSANTIAAGAEIIIINASTNSWKLVEIEGD